MSRCRCWCVNSAGQPVKMKPSVKRFYYLADAVKLVCPTVIASNNTKTNWHSVHSSQLFAPYTLYFQKWFAVVRGTFTEWLHAAVFAQLKNRDTQTCALTLNSRAVLANLWWSLQRSLLTVDTLYPFSIQFLFVVAHAALCDNVLLHMLLVLKWHLNVQTVF